MPPRVSTGDRDAVLRDRYGSARPNSTSDSPGAALDRAWAKSGLQVAVAEWLARLTAV